jgi:hypothetical protein
MKILIDLDDNVKAAIDDYYSGKIGYIGLENGFLLLEAVKNGTSFSNKEDQEPILDMIKQAKEIMANKAHADADGEIVVDISDALSILSELVD